MECSKFKNLKKGLFFLLLFIINIGTSQTNGDSLTNTWKDEKKSDSIRFNALEEYYEINNQIKPDSTLAALDYHYELANEKNATLQLYRATKRKGNIHRLKGNYDIAMEAYTEAKNLAKLLNDPILQAKIMGNMGNIFVYRQNYKQATEHFSKALKLYQELNNSDGESHMLTSLGSVFLTINNYDIALEYYEKALSILNKRGFEDRSTAIIFINMGWTNFEKGLYLDAKTDYEKGLKILQVKNEKFFIADCYAVLASIHLKINQLEKANDYANKNLALNKELDIKSGIINAEITIAKIYFETDVDEALKRGESILVNLPSDTFKEFNRDLYELLYKCYKSQSKFDLSLNMYEKYTVYRDSIQQEKNNFAVVSEAVKNDFELKVYENKLENEKEKAALKVSQLKRTFFILITSSLLIFCIVFYFRSKIKKNQAKRELLLNEIEKLKNNANKGLIVDSNKFELNKEKIEHAINRKLNETDWKVLNLLLENPVITNKEIAEKVFMSVDGIGSSLRRMYEYFNIKESKYKKISLLLEGIKISNNSSTAT
ncbi:MAG: tetratricopeptide (TPR) repeat protein [Flavobacteriaceae bacterium]|jgi:tetratricopeptide (TPR) repeat protein